MGGDTVKVGRVSITALAVGPPGGSVTELDIEFPGVPADAWEVFASRFPRCFPAPGIWSVGLTAWLVRAPELTVLVDTGEDPATDAHEGGLLAALAAHGTAPDDIDRVFLTHLDGDHVGGAITTRGNPTFPRARYAVTRAEWDHVHQPAARRRYEKHGAYLDRAFFPLERFGVLDLIEGETRLSDELTVIPAFGHTPGHAVLLVSSAGQQALLLADTMHHPAQVTELSWASRFDNDSAAAAATRARLAGWAAREGMIVAATHFPAPGFGRIIPRDGGLLWEPL